MVGAFFGLCPVIQDFFSSEINLQKESYTILILVEIRDQSGLDWGGIGLELDVEPRGIGREDGAGVASLLFKDRDFWGGAWE